MLSRSADQVGQIRQHAKAKYPHPCHGVLLGRVIGDDLMTPPSAETHHALKRWVEQGGWLVVVGDDSAYASVADTW